jgi:hypothetical protein
MTSAIKALVSYDTSAAITLEKILSISSILCPSSDLDGVAVRHGEGDSPGFGNLPRGTYCCPARAASSTTSSYLQYKFYRSIGHWDSDVKKFNFRMRPRREERSLGHDPANSLMFQHLHLLYHTMVYQHPTTEQHSMQSGMQRMGSRSLSTGSCGSSHDPFSLLDVFGNRALGCTSRELLGLYCDIDEAVDREKLPEKSQPLDLNGSMDFTEAIMSQHTDSVAESWDTVRQDERDTMGDAILLDTTSIDPFSSMFLETREEPLFDFIDSASLDHHAVSDEDTLESIEISAAATATSTTDLKHRGRRRSTHATKRQRRSKSLSQTTADYTDQDVLLGRGGLVNHHPGNKAYLQHKTRLQPRYRAASRTTKTSISLELVAWVHARGGRFLDRDVHQAWYEVDTKRARAKASQTLREA